MILRTFPGGWYGDARGAAHVVLIKGSHLRTTSSDRVELPRSARTGLPQNLIFLDLAPDGVTFAGVGNDDDRCWEWHGSRWWNYGEAFGPRAVMYDHTGKRHIVGRPVAHGYRYEAPDGRLVTASETESDLVRRIWEFTELPGGITIGQGGKGIYGEDPAIVIIDGVRRLIAEGTCRFLKPRRVGDQITVPYVREDLGAAVIATYTIAELRALPLALDTQPAPPSNPQPPAPNPAPTPEPTVMESKPLPAAIHAIVVALYRAHTDLAKGPDDQRRVLQKRICETVRFHHPPDQTATPPVGTYGWKSNHGIDIANSTDALAELPAGVTVRRNERQEIHMWDLFDGHSREPFPPHLSEVGRQFFVPVEPIDHLANVPIPIPPVPPLPPAPPPAPPPAAPRVTYDRFVHVESHRIREAYAKRNGHDSMNESDLAHTLWRRLVERWTFRDVIHDILGEPYEDGGMGGER